MLFTNSMWTVLWSKAVPYARHISSKIMACCNSSFTPPSPYLHLHHPHLEVFRPGRRDCRSRRIHFLVVDSGHARLHCLLHLPDLPTSSGQEHDNSVFGCIFTCNSGVSVMAFGREVPARTRRSIGASSIGVLDSEYWSAHVYLPWRMS